MEARIYLLFAVLCSAYAYDYPPYVPIKDDVWFRSQVAQTDPNRYGSITWDTNPAILAAVEEAVERASLDYGVEMLQQKDDIDNEMKTKNLTLPQSSPSYVHQKLFKGTSLRSAQISKQGYKMDQASKHLKESLNLSKMTAVLDMYLLGSLVESEFCADDTMQEEPADCTAFLRYRSADGTCNNLENPLWGAAFTPFRRIAIPDYGDGVSTLRLATDGADLPSARLVSSKVNIKPNSDSASLSVLHMTFGQFLDHDLDFAPLNKGVNGEPIPCCPEALGDPPVVHPECAPIDIPADDPFYSAFDQTCMEFVRSAPCPRCKFGPREQINEKTAYIDGSQIYGFNETIMNSLRTMTDGLLISQVTSDGEELLPPNTDPTNGCNREEQMNINQFCFRAGDNRLNEQVLLALFHTVWARYHNHMAIALKGRHNSWSDEQLFQEARRTVVAQLQHVIYNEYLTSIFGNDLMEYYEMKPLPGSYYRNYYNNGISAGISAEFATAGFRFGHSQITGHLTSMDESGDVTGCQELSSVFMNPFQLYTTGSIPTLLRGEVRQHAGALDPSFTRQVAGKLFRGALPHGLDLVSLNLQRGRDHGVASYNSVRTACGYSAFQSFNDLLSVMDNDRMESLKSVYSNVNDIDLFVGGLSERPIWGSKLGPTFNCILIDQFFRLLYGDRYWYEFTNGGEGFTANQRNELHQTTLASIMCTTIPELKAVQERPLEVVSADNPVRDCSYFPTIDLSHW